MDSWSDRALPTETAERLLAHCLWLPEADWDGPLIPDAVLPSQWRRSPRFGPCERLMLEVLADAFHTLVCAPLKGNRNYRRALWEVKLWFEKPYMNVSVNLSDCCDALGLDVEGVQAVAQRLMRPQTWGVRTADQAARRACP